MNTSNKTVSFNEIKSIFDPEDWDVGFLTKEQLHRCANQPIKFKFHISGADFSNDVHFFHETNSIVLIRRSPTWDYTLNDEAEEILEKSHLDNYLQIYTHYKHAAVLSGLGVQARNSLIYSYKFGFDCHITIFGFYDKIVDVPTNVRENHGMWPRCQGCMDCVNACPVKAIHASDDQKEPFWLDADKCDNFIGMGEHETIPSIKSFWKKYIHPELAELADNIKSSQDCKQVFGSMHLPFDNNGYTYDNNVVKKDGKPIALPFCRECTSQPRCSKWKGKYPYNKINHLDIEAVNDIDKDQEKINKTE